MSSIEYQLMDRLARVKSRVLEVRARARLPTSTPLIDRIENVLRSRQTGMGLFPLMTRQLPTPAPAPAAAPTTQTQTQLLPTEELGIEAR